MAPKPEKFAGYYLSAEQKRVKAEGEAGKHGKAPKNCVVTGGTGFVGQRLVEMLVERGAERVVSFDIVPPAATALQHKAVEYVIGDIQDAEVVSNACKGADCVWHICAAVGPYHPKQLYHNVNVNGTANVIEACKKNGVKKLVNSSSPSTRFDGKVISFFNTSKIEPDGVTESDMALPPKSKTYTAEYAKTKAEAEMMVTAACTESLLTVSVAPHQVYGPRDNLFLPNFLEVAAQGKLRIFGRGDNRICFTHVDNYCHALYLGEKALYPGSPSLGKFYIATDGDTHPEKDGYCIFWDHIDKVCGMMGIPGLKTKFHLPALLMMVIGFICEVISFFIGRPLKLSRFSVKMLLMNRWFKITAIEKDLKYKPVIGFNVGWEDTCVWFKDYWMPSFDAKKVGGLGGGIAQQSQRKIDIQAGKKEM